VYNCDFWENLVKDSRAWAVIAFTETLGWYAAAETYEIRVKTAGGEVQDSLDERVTQPFTVTWKSQYLADKFTYDYALLEAYPTAGAVSITDIGDQTTTGTSPAFVTAVTAGGNFDLQFTLDNAVEVSEVILLDGYSLPSGLSIVGDRIVGTPVAETITFKVCVRSEFGLDTVVTIDYTAS
jgi:hypothetical protein